MLDHSSLKSFANQVVDSCGSTNDIARKLAENGYPHGTWTSARRQTSGRGRLGRQWESVEGNLFLSLVLRMESSQYWSWIPLTVAVALTKTLTKNFSTVKFRIKWPNDIWAENSKLGGILCEATGQKPGSAIIVGIGLNTCFSPKGLDQKVTDLRSLTQTDFSCLNGFRSDVIQSVLNEISILTSSGCRSIDEFYTQWAQFPTGSKIRWGSPMQEGIVKGLGPLGELCVTDLKGRALRLLSEDLKSPI